MLLILLSVAVLKNCINSTILDLCFNKSFCCLPFGFSCLAFLCRSAFNAYRSIIYEDYMYRDAVPQGRCLNTSHCDWREFYCRHSVLILKKRFSRIDLVMVVGCVSVIVLSVVDTTLTYMVIFVHIFFSLTSVRVLRSRGSEQDLILALNHRLSNPKSRDLVVAQWYTRAVMVRLSWISYMVFSTANSSRF